MAQDRPIVVVLGMHRSGTSLCAHVLSAMGIDMADEIRASASNARGHWERWEIVQFHDRILRLFNRDYFGPFHDLSLPVAWWADPRVSQIKQEIIAFLERRMGAGWFGFKDPRTVRLMPLWHQIFNELKLTPKIVLCLRNPAQVARSLRERDTLDPGLAEYRWLVYTVDFFRHCGGFEFCTVDYEEWFRDPYANFSKLKNLLEIEWRQSLIDLDLLLSGIVDPALRHDLAHHDEPRQPLVRSIYRLASDRGDAAARDEINRIITDFFIFQKLQTPLHESLEDLAGAAVRYSEVAQEAGTLRAEIEQRSANEAALRAEIEKREATEAALRVEIEQHAENETALQAEIAEHEATQAALRAEIEQRAASEVALRTEIALRADTASAAEVLQRENEVLRDKLTEAEQHCQEYEATNTEIRSELTTLSYRLAAAREVGRAVVASMRAEGVWLPRTRCYTGWARLLPRRFHLRGQPLCDLPALDPMFHEESDAVVPRKAQPNYDR